MSEAELALVERSENHTQTETARIPEDWFDRPAARLVSSEAIRLASGAELELQVSYELSTPGKKFLSGFVTDQDLGDQLFTADQLSLLANGIARLRGPYTRKEIPREYKEIMEVFLAHDGTVRRVAAEVLPDESVQNTHNILRALLNKCKIASPNGLSVEQLMNLGNPEREVEVTPETAHGLGGAASVGIISQPHVAPAPKRGAQILPSTGLPDRQRSWDDYDPDEPLAWQGDGLCAQTDPEAFFPDKGGSTRDAKKICSECEVRDICLQYALNNDERFGIWGGLSERERRKLKKRVA